MKVIFETKPGCKVERYLHTIGSKEIDLTPEAEKDLRMIKAIQLSKQFSPDLMYSILKDLESKT